ncbi:MAG: hypothetical protein WBF45_11980 [Acidobacteriaceae bacterium]
MIHLRGAGAISGYSRWTGEAVVGNEGGGHSGIVEEGCTTIVLLADPMHNAMTKRLQTDLA